jgi:hypothetical protein
MSAIKSGAGGGFYKAIDNSTNTQKLMMFCYFVHK